MQVARILISSAEANGQDLGDCWHLVLTSIQHLVWILGMTPSMQGGFRSDGMLCNYELTVIYCTLDQTKIIPLMNNKNSNIKF